VGVEWEEKAAVLYRSLYQYFVIFKCLQKRPHAEARRRGGVVFKIIVFLS